MKSITPLTKRILEFFNNFSFQIIAIAFENCSDGSDEKDCGKTTGLLGL